MSPVNRGYLDVQLRASDSTAFSKAPSRLDIAINDFAASSKTD